MTYCCRVWDGILEEKGGWKIWLIQDVGFTVPGARIRIPAAVAGVSRQTDIRFTENVLWQSAVRASALYIAGSALIFPVNCSHSIPVILSMAILLMAPALSNAGFGMLRRRVLVSKRKTSGWTN